MKNVDAAMESMKNTLASAEAVMNKIKEGEGSVGKFINDPSLYDDIRAAIQSVNLLLGKAGLLRTFVDIGGWRVPVYNGTKGFFRVQTTCPACRGEGEIIREKCPQCSGSGRAGQIGRAHV